MRSLIVDAERTRETKSFLQSCLKKYYKFLHKAYGSEDYDRPVMFLQQSEVFARYDNFFKTHFEGERVVDIGCASGFFSIWISMYAEKVIGFDINPKNLKSNRIMLKAAGRTNVEFMTMNAIDLTKDVILKNNINGVFWHKTCFGEMEQV